MLLKQRKENEVPGGGEYSLIWPMWGCAAGQGMVFILSVLNRVYNFARVCPQQGIQFRESLLLNSVHDLCESVLVMNLRELS